MKKFFILLIFFSSCKEENKELFDAISKIENTLTKEELIRFSNKDESKAISEIHFGYGLKFRNEVLKDSKDSTLVKYFNYKGIYHLDDMSSIVFKSLHRKLNSKNIDLENQIRDKIKYWEPIQNCEKDNLKRQIKNGRFIKGDTIQIRMFVDTLNKNAYQVDCPKILGWKPNNNLDLLLEGIIEKKYTYSNIENDKFLKVKIISKNKNNIKVYNKPLQIGDTLELKLLYSIIENIK
ncbi:DUF6794 domain-containing protein [Flavobacterium orientale]|uniref:DUF6794 domain-containing protein n=1 Tax=Flavobacterium orientale TaxID=1756020 RepID=A0A916Y857_9FLAO|nr:DUF6794 domain-containing protein [Flavobacterium orientale]GGD34293.1 hypothetical protein GCM10011343_25220 [Flavobacterium orientale]